MFNNSILVIDDEQDLCLLMSTFLRHKDYQVETGNSLADCFRLLGTFMPNMMILDLKLPDGMSLDAIRGIRDKYPLLKLIVISAFRSDDYQEQAYSDGADFYLEKPFTNDTLLNAVQHISRTFPTIRRDK